MACWYFLAYFFSCLAPAGLERKKKYRHNEIRGHGVSTGQDAERPTRGHSPSARGNRGRCASAGQDAERPIRGRSRSAEQDGASPVPIVLPPRFASAYAQQFQPVQSDDAASHHQQQPHWLQQLPQQLLQDQLQPAQHFQQWMLFQQQRFLQEQQQEAQRQPDIAGVAAVPAVVC